METETIKSKRRLSQSMGDLYLLKGERDILERPDINRGYVMATSHKENLYSYSFALCDEPHEVGELDRIIEEKFGDVDLIVPIPFDVEVTKGKNSLDLENYLNRHFKLHILKTKENELKLFQRNYGDLITRELLLIPSSEKLSYEIRLSILTEIILGNIPITNYLVID